MIKAKCKSYSLQVYFTPTYFVEFINASMFLVISLLLSTHILDSPKFYFSWPQILVYVLLKCSKFKGLQTNQRSGVNKHSSLMLQLL